MSGADFSGLHLQWLGPSPSPSAAADTSASSGGGGGALHAAGPVPATCPGSSVKAAFGLVLRVHVPLGAQGGRRAEDAPAEHMHRCEYSSGYTCDPRSILCLGLWLVWL